MTQRELAERTGLTVRCVGRAERNEGSTAATTVGRIARVTGVTMESLIGPERPTGG